jgi:hypothetical protein
VQDSELIVDLDRGLTKLGLPKRLRDTPSSAHTRGLFFNLAEAAVALKDPALLPAWRAASGARRRFPFKLYPTRDFIREQATAAVLVRPDDPETALFEMWLRTPTLSPLIKAERFIRYLTGRDPARALLWLEKNRGMMCDYGLWRLEQVAPKHFIFHIAEEWVWIDSAHTGGATGTLERCGVVGTVTAELVSDYHGKLDFIWQ